MTTIVNTKHVTKRKVRLPDLNALSAEVDRIVAADQAGRLKTLGNWTAGQNLAHLAAWIEYGNVGYPISPPPWPISFILRTFMKRRYLRHGMMSGVKIPGVKDGTVGQDAMTTIDAAERLKRAIVRLRSEPARYPSPAFGPMPEEERVLLNLRHAEHHLGFLTY